MSAYPERLREDVYQENGYAVQLEEEKVTVKFKFKEEWLDVPQGEVAEYNEVLFEKNDSVVLLKRVMNQGQGTYSFTFGIEQDLDADGGKFLSHHVFTESGGFRSKEEIFNFFGENGKDISDSAIMLNSGSGPGETFGGDFNSLDLLEEIELSLFLYRYSKL